MTTQRNFRRRVAPILVAATMCAAFFGGASSAWAGVALSVSPDIPLPNGPVTVGQTNLHSTLTISNGSTGSQFGLNVTLDTITIVPSCGVIASINCPAASFDPDVFALGSTGSGEAGTACAGATFAINNVDNLQDKYEFVPTVPATPVVLGPASGTFNVRTCIIDFTADVLKAPTIDARPDPGIQTNELAGANGTATDLQTGQGTGTNNTTVNKAALNLATAVSPTPITLGQLFHDTATLSGAPAASPAPTGSVTFSVYPTADCSGAPAFTSTNALNAAGTTATSDNFTPTAAGTYHVIASYSGDANYNSATSLCADPAEQVVVNKATLTLATAVSPTPITLGNAFHDTATLAGAPAGSPTPTGTVTFDVYSTANCTGAPAFTSTNAVNAAGTTATSDSFTPTGAGTYRVIASYSGDANYNSATTLCADPAEQVVVNKATLTLATNVSPTPITLGQAFHDTATLSGKPAAAPAPTGTVTFDVYANATCTGAPASTSTNALNGAGTTATSDDFTPTAPGQYHVIATYSGDANYTSQTSLCGDAAEQVTVNKATLTIATNVSPTPITIGSAFHDTATLAGKPAAAPTPTGTVTFSVYSNATCTGVALFTSTNAVNAAGTTATSDNFTPTAPGLYRVIASYSGDTNYNALTSACADTAEQVTVNKATITIATNVSPTPITLGQAFHDTATLSGAPAAAPTPTGTVTFSVYSNATCTGVAVFTSTNAVNAAGTTATSDNFTPTAPGLYRVIAVYSGDTNYTALTSSCTDTAEQVTVNKLAIPIATAVSPTPITIGSAFHDTATLGPKPAGPTPTGTVTFRVYDNPTCTGASVFSSTNAVDAAGTTATSDDFTPTSAGTYQVIATYSGDANYDAIASSCTDPLEVVVVNKGGLVIQTQVQPGSITLGSPFHDTATLSGMPAGAPAPTGTVTFAVYDNDTCTGPPTFSSTNPVDATGTTATSDDFTPTVPGSDRVIATYSGDTNYPSLTSLCDEPTEVVTVAAVVVPPPPPAAPVTPHGTAAISGKTGCQGTPFNVVVNGRQIARVIYSVDGRVVKTLTHPNSGTRFKLPVKPSTLTTGTHRVLARVIYTKASGTKNRTLRVVFTRCAHKAALPAFTG